MVDGSEAQTGRGQVASPRLKAALASDPWQLPEVGQQESPTHSSSSVKDNGPPTPLGWAWGFRGLEDMILTIPPNIPGDKPLLTHTPTLHQNK